MNPDKAIAMLVEELDAETVNELIEQFLVDTPAQIAELRNAARNGDTPTVRRMAHSIAGSSSTFGLEDLRAACVDLEATALTGEAAKIPAGIEAVVGAFDAALPILHRVSGR